MNASKSPEDSTSTGDSQPSESPVSVPAAPESKTPPAPASNPARNEAGAADNQQKRSNVPANNEVVETLDASKPSPPKSPPSPAPPNQPQIDASKASSNAPKLVVVDVEAEKRKDYVRLIVTIGLLSMLLIVIVWACVETASWPDHWNQTKEMLQIIFPALTGLIGSVLGFYFGAATKNSTDSDKSG